MRCRSSCRGRGEFGAAIHRRNIGTLFHLPLALARRGRFTPLMAATKTASIYAVIGTDDLEVKRVAKELSLQLGAGGDFGADIIDAQVENSEQADRKSVV